MEGGSTWRYLSLFCSSIYTESSLPSPSNQSINQTPGRLKSGEWRQEELKAGKVKAEWRLQVQKNGM